MSGLLLNTGHDVTIFLERRRFRPDYASAEKPLQRESAYGASHFHRHDDDDEEEEEDEDHARYNWNHAINITGGPLAYKYR